MRRAPGLSAAVPTVPTQPPSAGTGPVPTAPVPASQAGSPIGANPTSGSPIGAHPTGANRLGHRPTRSPRRRCQSRRANPVGANPIGVDATGAPNIGATRSGAYPTGAGPIAGPEPGTSPYGMPAQAAQYQTPTGGHTASPIGAPWGSAGPTGQAWPPHDPTPAGTTGSFAPGSAQGGPGPSHTTGGYPAPPAPKGASWAPAPAYGAPVGPLVDRRRRRSTDLRGAMSRRRGPMSPAGTRSGQQACRPAIRAP